MTGGEKLRGSEGGRVKVNTINRTDRNVQEDMQLCGRLFSQCSFLYERKMGGTFLL